MKSISKYLLSLAALSIFAVSCKEVEDPYTPGEPEESGCYGVFFPTQDASFAFEPTDTKTFTVSVSRSVDSDPISVPISVSSKAAEYISVEPAVFANGQAETEITVTVKDEIPQNEEFSVDLVIEDNKYASKYSSKANFLSTKIVVESWTCLGEGLMWDCWLDDESSFPVTFYQNNADSNRYRVVDIYKPFWEKWGAEYAEGGWNLIEPVKNLEFRVLTVGEILHEGDKGYETEIKTEDLVYYSPFKIGLNHPTTGADIYRYHPGDFSGLAGNDANFINNKVDNWQDPDKDGKVLPSVVYLSSYVYMPGFGGWGGYENTNTALVLQFPGGVFVDYSIEAEIGASVEGVAPVEFTLGKDVTQVLYAVYEGELTSKELRSKKALIAAGEEIAADTLDMETKAFGFSADTTARFTLVAVSFDKNGNSKESFDAAFGFVKPGDEEKVEITAGCYLEKLGPEFLAHGLDSTSNLVFSIYGLDITDVELNIVPKSYYDTAAVENLWSDMSYLTESQIKKVNEPGGFTSVWTGLKPFTEYVLLVNVFNGYQWKKYTAESMTPGLPLQTLCTGTYMTTAFYADTTETAELIIDPNNGDYTIDGFIQGEASITFGWDKKTGAIDLPFQYTGISDEEAGFVFVGEIESALHLLYEDDYQQAVDYFAEDGITDFFGQTKSSADGDTLYFGVLYSSSEGYIGFGLDVFVPDGETSLPEAKTYKKVSSSSLSDIKWHKATAIKPVKILQPFIEVDVEREVKAASYNTVALPKESSAKRLLSKPLFKK